MQAASILILLSASLPRTEAWGSSSSSSSSSASSTAIYGNKLSRDWLYDAQGISISVHGCLWSYMMDKNNYDARCLEQSSNDGTEIWYMMSNCRRAQVAFSVYASDSSKEPSCNSANFKESFVTKTSAMDFVTYVEQAGYKMNDQTEYPQCGSYNNRERDLGGGGGGGGGGGNGNDNKNKQNYQRSNTPIGLSCASDGSFQLEQFADPYCLTRTGTATNNLNTFNQDMSGLNCFNIYGSNSYGSSSIIQYLIYISQSCSSHDASVCQDSEAAQVRHSLGSKTQVTSVFYNPEPRRSEHQSIFTKLKYVTGGLLMLASFVMFTGILFTNRRRRRALMQRKYRQQRRPSGRGSSRSRRSSRSASKHRDAYGRKIGSSRSKSREGPRSPGADADADDSQSPGILS